MADWLSVCKVTAAAMEATGIYWEAPLDALEAAGIRPLVLNAQHVKQVRGRKTDVGDSVWLARVCQFGLARPSLVLPKRYRELRAPGRHRRQAAEDRARFRNRAHKLVDLAGLRVGGVLSDIFGKCHYFCISTMILGSRRRPWPRSATGRCMARYYLWHDHAT